MDIIAKAKPVRFRIVSGGVECTSLDDLRTHFDLKSVADTINDGRLEKWLNYIKEFEFAKQVRAIGKFEPSDMKMSLRVLSLFTGREYNRENFMSDIEFIKFLESDKNTSGFAIDLMKESIHKDIDVLLYAYHNHVELITDVHACFEPFLSTSNTEVMWLYGKLLIDSKVKSDVKKGLNYIKEAAKKSNKEANDFLNSKEISEIDRKLKCEIDEERMPIIQGIIERCLTDSPYYWTENVKQKLSTYISSLYYTDAEKDVFKLCAELTSLVSCNSIDEYKFCMEKIRPNGFGTMNNVFRFLYLYALEIDTHPSKSIEKYMELNYEPAKQRAIDLKRGVYKRINVLVTKDNKLIKMYTHPNYKNYLCFVHSFLLNLFNF